MWRNHQTTPDLLAILQAPGVIAHLGFGFRYHTATVPNLAGKRFTILVQVPGGPRKTVVAGYFYGKAMDQVGILEANRKQQDDITQFGFAICSGWVTSESLATDRARAIEKKAEVAAKKADVAARKVAREEERIRRFGTAGGRFI